MTMFRDIPLIDLNLQKMLEKVKGGKIDVVIAKDLSRIGRNNGKSFGAY